MVKGMERLSQNERPKQLNLGRTILEVKKEKGRPDRNFQILKIIMKMDCNRFFSSNQGQHYFAVEHKVK